MKQTILSQLTVADPWKEHFLWFDEIDSTNDYLKRIARQDAAHGTVVIADRQTGGHGRRGRTFLSPGGVGIYLSLLIRPGCSVNDLMHLTCATAVAMCDAVEEAAGFRPGIKWTNDLVYGKRKLGGILTELSFTPQGQVDYAIIGVGINCCQQEADFDPEIRDMAGSLAMVSGKGIDRSRVAAAMMDALYRMDQILLVRNEDILIRYRENCITLNREVSLVRGDEVRHGYALNVDEAGALIVRFSDGHTEAVNSGEVSVRGMYGYL